MSFLESIRSPVTELLVHEMQDFLNFLYFTDISLTLWWHGNTKKFSNEITLYLLLLLYI